MEKYTRFDTETLYFIDEFEDCVVKSEPLPKGRYFIKRKQGDEFQVQHTHPSVVRSFHGLKEITKDEYENY